MDLWGDEFEALYEKLEREQKGRKTVKAQQLWTLGGFFFFLGGGGAVGLGVKWGVVFW